MRPARTGRDEPSHGYDQEEVANCLAVVGKALYTEQEEKYNAGIGIIRRVDSLLRRCQLGRTES